MTQINISTLNPLMLPLNMNICFYVNDILLLSSSLGMINKIHKVLASNFDVKDMREVYVILGIIIIKISDSLILSHEYYVEKDWVL